MTQVCHDSQGDINTPGSVVFKALHLKEQVVFQDSLNWLQQVGAQRKRAFQRSLPIPEELGQSFTPHALGQRLH